MMTTEKATATLAPQLVLLNEDVLEKRCGYLYNLPKMEERDFQTEWSNMHTLFVAHMEQIGLPSPWGDLDFGIGDDWSMSRHICIELYSPRMLMWQTICHIWKFINSLPIEYCLIVTFDVYGAPDINDATLYIVKDGVYASTAFADAFLRSFGIEGEFDD